MQLDQGKQETGCLYKFKLKKKKSLSQNLSHKVVRAKCLLGRQFWTEGTGRAMISCKQSHGEDTHICRWNENVDKHQKLGKTGFYQHRLWCHSRTSKHDITVLFFPSTEKAMRQQARKFYLRKGRMKKFLLSGWLRAFFLQHIKGAAQITGWGLEVFLTWRVRSMLFRTRTKHTITTMRFNKLRDTNINKI